MEKSDIENYIDKLSSFESALSSESSDESNLINDLNKLLETLGEDIRKTGDFDMTKIKIKIKKIHPEAVIPKYSKDGDAGMDLTVTNTYSNTTFEVEYGFGIAMEIPKGYVGLLFPRSSIRKTDLILSNSVGVIDSGYRGEIRCTFKKSSGLDSISYKNGERAAQIIILPYPTIEFVESAELSSTERGDGGFGSTGS